MIEQWQALLAYLRDTPLKKQMKYKGKDKKFFDAAKAVYRRKVGIDVWISRN